MPITTEYTTDDELTGVVADMLANSSLRELADLREYQISILCCLKVRMDDTGETKPPKGSPVKLKKLSDMERLFVNGNAHYIMVVDYHFWKHADKRQQTAKLFDVLMDIKPEPTDDEGVRLKKRQPSIELRHVETVAYFGAFDEPSLNLRDAVKNIDTRLQDFVEDIGREQAAAENNGQSEAAEPTGEEAEAPAEESEAPAEEVPEEATAEETPAEAVEETEPEPVAPVKPRTRGAAKK